MFSENSNARNVREKLEMQGRQIRNAWVGGSNPFRGTIFRISTFAPRSPPANLTIHWPPASTPRMSLS